MFEFTFTFQADVNLTFGHEKNSKSIRSMYNVCGRCDKMIFEMFIGIAFYCCNYSIAGSKCICTFIVRGVSMARRSKYSTYGFCRYL